MSSIETSIGCPSCDDRTVEVVTDGGELDPAFRESDRLSGTTVECSSCGDEFDVYFY